MAVGCLAMFICCVTAIREWGKSNVVFSKFLYDFLDMHNESIEIWQEITEKLVDQNRQLQERLDGLE